MDVVFWFRGPRRPCVPRFRYSSISVFLIPRFRDVGIFCDVRFRECDISRVPVSIFRYPRCSVRCDFRRCVLCGFRDPFVLRFRDRGVSRYRYFGVSTFPDFWRISRFRCPDIPPFRRCVISAMCDSWPLRLLDVDIATFRAFGMSRFRRTCVPILRYFGGFDVSMFYDFDISYRVVPGRPVIIS